MLASSNYSHSKQLPGTECKTLLCLSLPMWLVKESSLKRFKSRMQATILVQNHQKVAKKSFSEVKFKFQVMMSFQRFFSTLFQISLPWPFWALWVLTSEKLPFLSSASPRSQSANSCWVYPLRKMVSEEEFYGLASQILPLLKHFLHIRTCLFMVGLKLGYIV